MLLKIGYPARIWNCISQCYDTNILFRSLHIGQRCKMKKRKLGGTKNFMEFPVKGTIQYVSRQLADPFVTQRHLEGYRCRSVYKLIEIDEKHKLLKPGMQVLDLGAAPGSWSQVAAERVIGKDGKGQVVAVDLLKFPPLKHVTQVTGDFSKGETQNIIQTCLKKEGNMYADVVLCDAAPSASGFKSNDHLAIVQIIAAAINVTFKVLTPSGNFLFKILDGTETTKIKKFLSTHFESVTSVKPKASRNDSAEHFILCKHYRKHS